MPGKVPRRCGQNGLVALIQQAEMVSLSGRPPLLVHIYTSDGWQFANVPTGHLRPDGEKLLGRKRKGPVPTASRAQLA